MKLYTKAELAHLLGYSTKRIDYLVESGELPKPITVGKSKRWPEIDIKNFIDAKIAERDAQGGAEVAA